MSNILRPRSVFQSWRPLKTPHGYELQLRFSLKQQSIAVFAKVVFAIGGDFHCVTFKQESKSFLNVVELKMVFKYWIPPLEVTAIGHSMAQTQS